jgi:molybdopterin-guanine dinucleotide biosynthesis protein A
VLAGGASRRLSGAPKGLELVGNRRIIDRVATTLQSVTPELLLVANDANAFQWLPDVVLLSDLRRGLGGLAGVETALSRGRDAVVVAWDMPFVSSAILRALVDAASAHGAEVAVPESDAHEFEPFCAFYAATVLPALSAFLDGGGGAAREFVRRLPRVHRMPLTEVERFGDPRTLFFSVNTPADLEHARAVADAQ